MAYVLLDSNNVVIQKQPYPQDGFIEVPDSVVAGQIKQGSVFIDPPPSPVISPPAPAIISMTDTVTGEIVSFAVTNGQFIKQQGV